MFSPADSLICSNARRVHADVRRVHAGAGRVLAESTQIHAECTQIHTECTQNAHRSSYSTLAGQVMSHTSHEPLLTLQVHECKHKLYYFYCILFAVKRNQRKGLSILKECNIVNKR